MRIILGIITFFLFSFVMSNFSIEKKKVAIINGTKNNRSQVIKKLKLLRLENGMQLIKSFNYIDSLINLEVLENERKFPYMLQGIYKGVNYNQIISPTLPANQQIQLKVYEKRHLYQDIDLRILYVIRYVDQHLDFLVFYKFNNKSLYTFIENNNGIHFFIPQKASNINASVSVGSGLSNIQWLKIGIKPIMKRQNTFTISYPLKPGERIYQLSYQFPYDGLKLSIPFKSMYPLAEKSEILLETKNIDITIPQKPEWSQNQQNKQKNDSLMNSFISLPHLSGILNVIFKGGDPASNKNFRSIQSEDIRILSPLDNFEKLIYSILCFTILLGSFIYIQKPPMWLIQSWLKHKSLLEYQLNSIQKSSDLKYVQLTKKFKKQLSMLNEKLKQINN